MIQRDLLGVLVMYDSSLRRAETGLALDLQNPLLSCSNKYLSATGHSFT